MIEVRLHTNTYQELRNIFEDVQNQEVDIQNLRWKIILLLFHIRNTNSLFDIFFNFIAIIQ